MSELHCRGRSLDAVPVIAAVRGNPPEQVIQGATDFIREDRVRVGSDLVCFGIGIIVAAALIRVTLTYRNLHRISRIILKTTFPDLRGEVQVLAYPPK